MKVIKNFGKLKGSKDVFALMVLDDDITKYVICKDYDPTLPEGRQWRRGYYYFNFEDFVEDVYKLNERSKANEK